MYPVSWIDQNTLHFIPWQTCSFWPQLDFSGKHSSHAASTREDYYYISSTIHRQLLIYTAEWTGATEMRWPTGVSLLEHRRNEEILEEAKVEPIAMVMRRRRLEWFGHVKRRNETENIRVVVEMKMERKRPRGRRGRILSGGTWKPGTSGRNGSLTGNDGDVSARPATPHREMAAKGEKGEKVNWCPWRERKCPSVETVTKRIAN